jgi:hypothetical protein
MTQNGMAPGAPQTPSTHDKEHNKWLYVGGIVIAVILAIVLLATFTQRRHSAQADAKAQELQTKMVAAGYPLPDKDTVVAIFGTDGGAVCKNPTGALSKALWLDNMTNGAGGPGLRPVIADHRALVAEAIVVSIYCPEHLQAFQDNIDDLKTGTTVRG